MRIIPICSFLDPDQIDLYQGRFTPHEVPKIDSLRAGQCINEQQITEPLALKLFINSKRPSFALGIRRGILLRQVSGKL